jgi:putative ABC transport system permease protein
MRNPRRTAATAAALMIGLAVVAAIATLASSATASFGALFTTSIKADYVVTSNQETLSKSAEPAVRSAPGVTEISPFTEVQFHHGGATHVGGAIDPVTGPRLIQVRMVTGSVSALARGEVLVDTSVAKDHHYAVGDRITMGFASTGEHTFTIGGTYKPNQLLDGYLMSIHVAAANTNQPVDEAILVKVTHPSSATQAALGRALGGFPQLKVQTSAQYVDTMKNRVSGFLRFVYVLLGLSIVIALIGVVNTLVLSVLERTHEIGLLRAVGMVRRQVRRMIRGEAVVVSVLGAALGLALGVGLGAAIVKAVSGSGIGQLVIPVGTIVVVLVLAVAFGIFAAIFPARRAARLDVLRAVSTE